MSPRHHPLDENLMAFAAGGLSAGLRLVMSVHLSGCARCRTMVRGFETIGGALVEGGEADAPGEAALQHLLARIDEEDGRTGNVVPLPAAQRTAPMTSDGIALPRALARHAISPWRRLPGFQWARVRVTGAPEANVVLLRFPAGQPAPRHGHTGTEFTQVVYGGFSDGRDHYEAGDLSEADQHIDHQPLVDQDGDCICIAAVEGRLRIRGIGRLVQPFIGL